MDRAGMTTQSVAGREDVPSRHHQHHPPHHQHHHQHHQWSGHPLPPPSHSYPTDKDGSNLMRSSHPSSTGTLINTGGPFFPLDFPGPSDNADFPSRPVGEEEGPTSHAGGSGPCMGPTLHPTTTSAPSPDRQGGRPGHTSRGPSTNRRGSSSDDITNPARRMRRRELSQFSPDEADRIVRRRERNKVAATKCRHKRREQHEELVKELQDMECENTSLTYEIRQLQRQRQALSDVLRHHQMSCPTRLQFDMSDLQHPTGQADNMSGPYPLSYTR